jgi:DUF971 family protein
MARGETSMTIVWSDGHRTLHGYDALRRECPCATCRTERESAERASGLRVLPADAPVRAVLSDVQWVGWYGFRLAWEDGHDTGIYSFEYLRALCECPECKARRTG